MRFPTIVPPPSQFLGQLPHQGKLAIGALVASKCADILTTIAGLLLFQELIEANPVARNVIAVAGVPGLVGLSLVAIGIVVCAVEWGIRIGNFDERMGTHGRLLLYAGSYYPLTMLYIGATVHNLHLISAEL